MHRELKIVKRKSLITNRYKGLTLAEVIVASTLLLIVMVPILKALTSAQVSSTIIEQKTRSLILAQAKLEDIKARSIYDFSSVSSENNVPLDGLYIGKVECTSKDGNNDLKNVIVAVGYDNDANGSLTPDEIQVTLVTLIARRW
jgi:Tfp pilus assembly protein PilV